MRHFLFLLLITLSLSGIAQDFSTTQFNQSKNKITKNGMWVLGGWGTANIVGSGIGAFTTTGETQAFHQMNVGWGIINTGLAALSLAGNKNAKTDLSQVETVKQLEATKRIFLVNAALDVAYMATGTYMIEKSKSVDDIKRSDLLSGFGKSFILQGAGLMIFDAIMYAAHTRNGNRKLYNNISGLSIGPSGFYVAVSF
ncbi:hypothetical protein Oweho_2881 [Owenweeksia hongkongensis DSM 17368]|uniref:DUF5683 domain-containing protein n=1 Tax=Owenweeksia hongkongensis (strain DSM 17368 / CIP 108786 / JCM 12287 / NRRL B-23963 / UST20020801) TaxID=926562 RepID=G8R196_OWEHD|nr:hypothetical protein [Owenweeksia hongkongensis]AEV33839.1 hypothetical protein Oweho_2881 [Owenweeksia hongkongensis DSM 17368]